MAGVLRHAEMRPRSLVTNNGDHLSRTNKTDGARSPGMAQRFSGRPRSAGIGGGSVPSARTNPASASPGASGGWSGSNPRRFTKSWPPGKPAATRCAKRTASADLPMSATPFYRQDHHRRAFTASTQRLQCCQFRLAAGKPRNVVGQLCRDGPPVIGLSVRGDQVQAQQVHHGTTVCQAATCRPMVTPEGSCRPIPGRQPTLSLPITRW